MNKLEREAIKELRQSSKKEMNRYRFAWWLIENQPNLVVSVLQEHIKAVDEDLAGAQAAAKPEKLSKK